MDGKDPGQRRRVFLSYARTDRARVAKIAAGLDAAGIDVWWDQEIQAGSPFANDIERELQAADVIVVAWSATSINSTWVLDEAGVGRDRGRLAPILLDAVKPPLGFRQLQSIDLTAWHGDESDPLLAAAVNEVSRLATGTTPARPAAPPRRRILGRRTMVWVGLLVVAVGLAVGWRFLTPAPSAKPVVAVLPFTDASGPKGEAYFAEGLAEDILDTLARDGRFRVLGGATARAIRDRAGDPTYARNKLGVTRLLEGSVRGGDEAQSQQVKVSVRLIDTSNGYEVWSQSFDASGADVISVQDAVANAVAAQIAGQLIDQPKMAAAAREVAPGAYENVVIARQLIRARQADSLARAREMADAAIAAQPDYAAAYAARSAAITLLTRYGDAPAATESPKARGDAEMAIKLDPGLSEGYDALGLALWFGSDLARAIESARRAVAVGPANAEAHLHLAYYLYEDAQPLAAASEFSAASALDPLWVVPVTSLIESYGDADQPEQAVIAANRFRALSLDLADTNLVDSHASHVAGNYALAIKLANAAIAGNPKLALAVRIRDELMTGLFAGNGSGPRSETVMSVSGLAASGHIASAAAVAAKLGPKIWDDPTLAENLADLLVAGNRSTALLESFDSRFPDVAGYMASAPAWDRSAIPLAIALDRAGRVSEARSLRTFAHSRLLRSEAAGLSPAQNAIDWAGLLASAGDHTGAISSLRTGVAAQWWAVCTGPFWLDDLATLSPLRGERQFKSILEQCRSRLNAERVSAGLRPISLD